MTAPRADGLHNGAHARVPERFVGAPRLVGARGTATVFYAGAWRTEASIERIRERNRIRQRARRARGEQK